MIKISKKEGSPNTGSTVFSRITCTSSTPDKKFDS